ncbi:MAG: DNA-binding protein, partial [Prevotella pallens]|nr:DNA-binding protein [Prevotella pallens]
VTFTPSTELKKELADNSYETVKKDDEEKKKKEEGGTPSHP